MDNDLPPSSSRIAAKNKPRESENFEVLKLCDSFTKSLSMSDDKEVKNFESQSKSSLSDLAFHHLIRSTSGRAQCDKLIPHNTSCDSGGSKPVSCGFVIPFLSKSEDDPVRCQNSKSDATKSRPRLIDLLGARNADSDESINSTDDWVIDLSNAIRNPQSRNIHKSTEDKIPKPLIHVDTSNTDLHEESPKVVLPPCRLDARDLLTKKFPYGEKCCSSFGRVLCHSPKQLAGPYISRPKQFIGKVRRFLFDKPSPDDVALAHQQKKS